MSYIRRVEISGFWGDRNLVLDLYEDVNFLIGPNGSGKTTAINTIAAALTGNFANLDRLPFRSISITLHDPATKRKQSVEVTKKERPRSPFPAIDYTIRDGSNKPTQYSLDELAEERVYRDYYPPARMRQHLYRHATGDLTQRLKELAPTSWLSIHRAPGIRSGREERSHEVTVDQKLDEISNLLVRFFSELEKRSTDEAHKFQETIFLSLIYKHKREELFRAVQDLDTSKEQQALIDIFRHFKVPESGFFKLTHEHFGMLADAVATFERQESVTIDNVFIIMNTWRIHSVIQEWNSLIAKQKLIFKSRDTFLDIINDMLQRKELQINEKQGTCRTNSIGENVVTIGAFVRRKAAINYSRRGFVAERGAVDLHADEPELSLHVD